MASNLQKSLRNINIENPQTGPKLASTDFAVGMWLEWDGSGFLQPLGGGNVVEGLCLVPITAQDPDYASTKAITYDGIDDTVDRFLMPVTNGTADDTMIGATFDVDSNSYGLDVSGGGTQFLITKVITDALVEVKVVLTQ